jgi:hypothetical protein
VAAGHGLAVEVSAASVPPVPTAGWSSVCGVPVDDDDVLDDDDDALADDADPPVALGLALAFDETVAAAE